MLKKYKHSFLYRKLYLTFKMIIANFFRLLPINSKKIVFDNFNGKGYGCDPKYICEELIKSNCGYDLVWLAQKKPLDLPLQVRFVKYGSFSALKEQATAKIWIDNVKTSIKPRKRKSQFYLQTWHSSLGLKMNEADAIETLSNEYIAVAKKDASITDLMYANSSFRENKYKTAYWYHGPVIRCGLPRCTPVLSPSKKIREKVNDYFKIKTKNIILYAPTFRKDYCLDWYKFNYKKCLETLEKKFGGEFVLLMRLHPNASVLSGQLSYSDGVLNASDYPDIQELLAVSSVLITDYSGCMFDFAFAKKPVFLYTPDLRCYIETDRNLYFQVEELPFPVCESEEELTLSIELFDQEEYKKQCAAFFDRIGLREDGRGAYEVANIIMNVIEGKKYSR